MKKRIFAIIAMALVMLGTSAAGYAYWDQLTQNTSNQLEIGYGVRLEVPTSVQDTRALVPAGSFYAAYEADYTTTYVMQYTLTLEDPLQDGMEADLAVDISDFQINQLAQLFNNSSSVFTITVGTDAVAATSSADGHWDFANAFYFENNTVVVTISITLADNNDVNFDASDYNLVSGTTASFAIGFELSNSASSEAPVNPLQ